jgi:hypothetical protein
MPFLLAMDLPVGSQVPFQTNPQLPLDPIQLAIPLEVDQNQVESFDPSLGPLILSRLFRVNGVAHSNRLMGLQRLM